MRLHIHLKRSRKLAYQKLTRYTKKKAASAVSSLFAPVGRGMAAWKAK